MDYDDDRPSGSGSKRRYSSGSDTYHRARDEFPYYRRGGAPRGGRGRAPAKVKDDMADSAPASPRSDDQSDEGDVEGNDSDPDRDLDDEIDELLSDEGEGEGEGDNDDSHKRRGGSGRAAGRGRRDHDDGGDGEGDGDGDDGDDGEGGGDGDGDGDGDDDGEGGNKDEEAEEKECKWADCPLVLENQEALVAHVNNGTYSGVVLGCCWLTFAQNMLARAGNRTSVSGGRATALARSRRAGTHSSPTSVRTLARSPTYAPSLVSFYDSCTAGLTLTSLSGCGRQFTRSDAMNKHVRAIHGAGAGKKRRGEDIFARTADDEPSTADKDLAKDHDLEEVVMRVHGPDRVRYVAETANEQSAMRYVRERRPGAGKKRRVRRNKDGSDSDEFDEGASKRFPLERTIEGWMMDEARETEVPVMGRSRWQAKYIMAKAKLMLVDEENKMRRDELTFWLAEEARVFGPRGPRRPYDSKTSEAGDPHDDL